MSRAHHKTGYDMIVVVGTFSVDFMFWVTIEEFSRLRFFNLLDEDERQKGKDRKRDRNRKDWKGEWFDNILDGEFEYGLRCKFRPR
jgi:hypothetical protein